MYANTILKGWCFFTMCTAITYAANDFYFGRTLDNDISYNEEVVITPRNYPLLFSDGSYLTEHNAIIGMACVEDKYPLYYDAFNELGLCIAGLNFIGNGIYSKKDKPGMYNIAQYELVLWILSKCRSCAEAIELIRKTNIKDTDFSESLPCAKLHWLIADKKDCITLEITEKGTDIYENSVGVLTNNPPFPDHLSELIKYNHLTAANPQEYVEIKNKINSYSFGMGAFGLPGDLSSSSRFIRASYTKRTSVNESDDNESTVNQFFHILSSVNQCSGATVTENGKYETTVYTSCCNADRGIYYYKSYNNSRINSVKLTGENIKGNDLIRFALTTEEDIKYLN